MIRKARNIGMACMLAIAVAGAESVPAYAQSGVFYKGGAKEIITTSDDFFRDSDMTQMLPGDVYEGKAKIDNSSRENVKLFFRTAPDRGTTDAEGKQMLADFEISVMLRKDGKESTIYKGRTSGNSGYVSLGRYVPGEKADLTFRLKVPESHTNRFNMSASAIDWTFAAEKEPSKTAATPVRTWDDTAPEKSAAAAMLLTMTAAAVLEARRRCRRKEKTE
jgi:hypothetical protein